MDRNSSRASDAAAAPPGLARTFAASLAALLTGLALMLAVTEGGSAFTTENARRTAVARMPRLLPDFRVSGADGRTTTLHALLSDAERVWIVDFVYTRCRTVCSTLGSTYQRLQRQIRDRGLQQRVGLLSISFDPGSDDAAALAQYADRMQLDPDVWRIVTLTSVADRRRLLDAFGIMVLPAPLGEFEHNAALHVVDRHARLVRILDYGASAHALELARGLLP